MNGIYTYDQRRSKTYIRTHFPLFHIEEGFTEEDGLWLADIRETKGQMAVRARAVLDMIFDEASTPTCEYSKRNRAFRRCSHQKDVCCTIHGGLINAFLSVLGCPRKSLPTGCQFIDFSSVYHC